ncbi:pygopus homolog 1 [Pogona vitticeps]
MSAEHEKDPPGGGGGGAALKRARGGDGGLDGLGGPGVQLGSPDKKKRKSSVQGPSFPPPSEYAPPPNPSADHLIAANPFDDNYNSISYKPPLPSGNPYFANSSYPGFGGGYPTFRMPPHMLPRMSSPYGATYPLRNQPHPFPQNPVGLVFNRPQAINFGPHETVGFGNQPSYNANMNQNLGLPGQPHFRPSPGENFGHMPSQNTTQMSHHEMPVHFGPGNNPPFNNSPMESNPSYAPLPNHYGQSKPPPKPGANKHSNTPQHHPSHGTEDVVSSGNADVKTGNRSVSASQESVPPKNVDNLNSTHANGTPGKPRLARGGSAEGGAAEKGSKMPLHPSQHGHPSSEPVYPCGICTHEVNDDQDAILCEASCQKWFHRICTGMTESAYGLLTAEASAVWGCDTCMADKDVQLMRTRETVGPPVLNADA